MKKFNLLNFSLACALMAAPVVGVAQNMPSYETNWYKDYVGLGRVSVTAPASIAKSVNYTIANDGDPATTGDWGGPLSAISAEVAKANPYQGCSGVAPGSLTGKIALVQRGNCEFGVKAKQAQDAGAIAVVIVNNIPGGPVGMGAGAVGGTVSNTIPVIMVSQDDGAAIEAALNQSLTVTMNFSKWGKGLANDLAIVDRGLSFGHSFAMPVGQMGNASNVDAYKMVDCAVIGNFGTADATGVEVHSKLTWVPDNGNPTVVKTHVMTVGNFAAADSIKSPFADEVYALPNASGTGRFDMEYFVKSDVADDYAADDTMRQSFYVTSNILSKGRYNFATNEPFRSTYVRWGTADFMQGPFVYIAKGGYGVDDVQFAVSNGTPDDPTLTGPFDIFLYKWVDGANSQPQDGKMQSGENTLIASATKDQFGAGDTSGVVMNLRFVNKDDNTKPVVLQDNSWYWIAANIPAGNFLGSDGELNYQPRVWSRGKVSSGAVVEPFAITVGGNDAAFNDDPSTTAAMFPSEGSTIDVDSVGFAEQRDGQVAALPIRLTPHLVSVKNIANTVKDIELYPNPATDVLNVELNLTEEAKQVRYTIIDITGKRVSYEYHYNVKNDKYQIATSKLIAGTYYLMVSVDGVPTVKQFTIVK
jgi:PA domain.